MGSSVRRCAAGALVLLLAALFLGGCASPTRILRHTEPVFEPGREPAPADSVIIFGRGESVDQPYRLLGQVYEYTFSEIRFGRPSEEDIESDLRAMARSMGANAIAGAYTSEFNGKNYGGPGFTLWGTGVAIELGEEPEAPSGHRASFVVAVPPPKLPPDKAGHRKLSKWFQDFARLHLGGKGYYVVIPEDVPKELELDGLAGMSDAQLDELYGTWADLVLEIELLETGGINVGIAAKRAVAVRARVFSRSEREVVMDNTATGESASFGLVYVVESSMDAHKAAVAAALETLPQLSVEP